MCMETGKSCFVKIDKESLEGWLRGETQQMEVEGPIILEGAPLRSRLSDGSEIVEVGLLRCLWAAERQPALAAAS